MFSATVAQKPTIPVSDGTKKRMNSALLWNLLGALSTGPSPPALREIHHSSNRPIPSMNGAPIPSRNLMVSMPRQITAMFSSQKAKKHSHAPPASCAAPGHAGQLRGARQDDPQHRKDRLPADPGLDSEPSACHQGAQHRRNVRPTHSERGPHQHRKRDAVLGARVRVEQHGDQHNQVAEQDRADGLPPAHAARDQPRRQHVSRDADAHRHPQGNVVIESPRAPLLGDGREVFVVERGVVRRHYFQAPPLAARLRYWPRRGLPWNWPPATITSPRESTVRALPRHSKPSNME